MLFIIDRTNEKYDFRNRRSEIKQFVKLMKLYVHLRTGPIQMRDRLSASYVPRPSKNTAN